MTNKTHFSPCKMGRNHKSDHPKAVLFPPARDLDWNFDLSASEQSRMKYRISFLILMRQDTMELSRFKPNIKSEPEKQVHAFQTVCLTGYFC